MGVAPSGQASLASPSSPIHYVELEFMSDAETIENCRYGSFFFVRHGYPSPVVLKFHAPSITPSNMHHENFLVLYPRQDV